MDSVNISGKMTDMDFIIHILSNLPEEYEVAIESLEERLEDTSNKLSIEEVRTKLNARFARINKKKEKTKDELGFQAVEKEETDMQELREERTSSLEMSIQAQERSDLQIMP